VYAIRQGRDVRWADPAPSRRARSSIRWGEAALLFVVATLAIGTLAVTLRLDDVDRRALSSLFAWERLPESLGLGIEDAIVSGHRSTLDTQVFDALDLQNATSLLRFDSAAARARIERLPWVLSATVMRAFPGRVEVRIVERVPTAVWSHAGEYSLIDATGRVLGPIGERARADFPRVTGAGASQDAAHLLAIVASHPEIDALFDHAERIAERRWRIMLSNGSRIELPAVEPVDVLSEWMRSAGASVLLKRPATEIDLRVADRVSIRSANGGQR
jgi:cell division protein FtsQ